MKQIIAELEKERKKREVMAAKWRLSGNTHDADQLDAEASGLALAEGIVAEQQDEECLEQIKYRLEQAESSLELIENWNEAEAPTKFDEHYSKALELLRNRYEKTEIASLIAHLLRGEVSSIHVNQSGLKRDE